MDELQYNHPSTRRFQKETKLFKQHTNQHRERAAATECTQHQVLTTNCHFSLFAISINCQATSTELSTCTSYSSD